MDMVVEGRIGHDKHPGTFENFRFLYTWLYSIKHQVSLAPVWTWTALLPCVLGGGKPLLIIITTLSYYQFTPSGCGPGPVQCSGGGPRLQMEY